MRNSLPRVIAFLGLTALIALTLPRLRVIKGLCSRSYECAGLYRAVQGPFASHYRGEKQKICGDLALMANRQDLCSSRPEIFETDPWGYRNTQDVWARANQILLFGDSFTLGQGVTQDQTPAVQLSHILQKPVYNGGGKFEFNYLRWLVDHSPDSMKTVVFLHLERHHHTPVEVSDWDRVILENSFVEKWKIFWASFDSYNPAKILASRFDKDFLTPGLFPNRFADSVPLYELKNQKPFLFLPSSVNQYDDLRTPAFIHGEGDYFTGLENKLKARGINLIVALVPEKYSVYASLLANPPKPISQGPVYLDLLDQELSSRGVPYINLLPLLKKSAEENLASGEFVYWPDDTHWNGRGIQQAMLEVAKFL